MRPTPNETPQVSRRLLELDLAVALAVTELCPDVEVWRGVAVVLATEVVVLIGDVIEDAAARSQPCFQSVNKCCCVLEKVGYVGTYKRIECAAVVRSHQDAASGALGIADTWS